MNPIVIPSGSQNFELQSAVYIDTSTSENIDIFVGEDVHCSYFYYGTREHSQRTFTIASGGSIDVRGIIIGTNIDSQMTFNIKGTNIKAYMDILAFSIHDSNITVKGNANVLAESKNIQVRVDQTNILIGENAQVRGIPILKVATDDITGGHSCKMHRISGDTLFYLESHGIETKHAETMLIQSEIWKRLHIIQGTEEASNFCSQIFALLQNKYKQS